MNTSPRRVPDPEDPTAGPPAPGAPAAEPGSAPARRPEPRARLVVELTRATSSELDDLVEFEELNKTTIVNRALQMYAFLRKAERDGGQILLLDAGAAAPQRIRFL